MFTRTLILESASWLPWLLDILLKSVVLLAIAGLAAVACRRASAAQRHLVWTLAIVISIPVLLATAMAQERQAGRQAAPAETAPSLVEKPLDQSPWGLEYTQWFRRAMSSVGPIPPGRIERDGKRQRVIAGSRRNPSTSSAKGTAGKWYDEIGELFTNDEETTLAYTARNGKSWYMVFDGQEWGPYTDRPCITFNPQFSPDGKHVGYWANSNGWRIAVIDGRPGIRCNWGGNIATFEFIFSRDGRRVAYAIPEKGTGKEQYVIDNEIQPAYHRISGLVFSPDGGHYAYIALNDAGKCAVIRDGKEGQWYTAIGANETAPMHSIPVTPELQFSADGTSLAYAAYDNGQGFVVLNDRELSRYNHPITELALASSGKSIVYRVAQDAKEMIIMGAVVLPVPSGYRAHSLTVSPDGQHVGFVAENAGMETVYIDGKPGHAYPKIRQMGRGYIFFQADNAFHYFVSKGELLNTFVVEERFPRAASASASAEATPNSDPPVSFHAALLAENGSVTACEPVLVRIEERNESAQPVTMTAWASEWTLRVLVEDAKGRVLAASPRSPLPADLLTSIKRLKPGESRISMLAISAVYPFDTPGDYMVRVQRLKLQDEITVLAEDRVPVQVLPFDAARLKARCEELFKYTRRAPGDRDLSMSDLTRALQSVRHDIALPYINWLAHNWGSFEGCSALRLIGTPRALRELNTLAQRRDKLGKEARNILAMRMEQIVWDILGDHD